MHSAVNANVIRSVLKQSGNDLILVVTRDYLSKYTDKKGFAGLARALAKSYKYDKNPNSNFHDTALLPFFWGN